MTAPAACSPADDDRIGEAARAAAASFPGLGPQQREMFAGFYAAAAARKKAAASKKEDAA